MANYDRGTGWQPVIGIGEIAEMLGISRQAVNKLSARPGFPRELARLYSGRVYRHRDIVVWAGKQGRKVPGDPAHETIRGFICRCRPEGRAEADALLAEVDERLPGDPGERISRIISSLSLDYDAEIDGIWCDQWFAIMATDTDGRQVVVQCDQVEDGIAAVWKAYAGQEPA